MTKNMKFNIQSKMHLLPSFLVKMFKASMPIMATHPQNTMSIVSILSTPFSFILFRKEDTIDWLLSAPTFEADAP